MKKEKIDTLVSILLTSIGVVLMILPLTSNIDIKYILTTVMSLYIIINFGKYFLTYTSKDYEGLFTAIASILTCFIAIFLKINEQPKSLALTMLFWIGIMSIIKLKKADYYHDRQDKKWIIKIFNLICFLITGLLTTINLYYNSDVQVLLIGFFFLVHGILEFFEPLSIIIGKKEHK